jgi:outer membrane protein assembly factor BamB
MNKHIRLILAALVIMLVVAGCGQRSGVAWADLTIANNQQDILIAYENELTLVSRANGFVVTEDLEGTTNNQDASGLWQLGNSDIGTEFYTSPIQVTYNDETIWLVADYNNRLLYINFTRSCFATLTGSCVAADDPPSIDLPGHVVADMAEDAERIYIPLSEHDVIALNKGIYETGWDREDDDERRSRLDNTLTEAWLFTTERGVWAAPVVLGDAVYISTMDHHVFRVNSESGLEEATLDLDGAIADSMVFYDGTPATDYADGVAPPTDADYDLDNGRFYVGTLGRSIYEVPLDFETGSEGTLPRYRTDDWVWGSPKIVDGVLYAADLSGTVYALDITNDFEELWKVRLEIGGVRASPLVTEDHVIVASRDGVVAWLRRNDGSVFTQQDVRDEVLSDLLLIPGDEDGLEALVIVSTTNNSRLMSAFTIDGAPRWTYPSS